MKLREATVTDEEAIQLLTSYFTSREQSFPSKQGHYHRTFPTASDSEPPAGIFFLVITDDDRAVGCGGIRTIANSVSGEIRYEIKHLWLEPDARHKGWATILMHELESRARDFGATEVVLDTNSSLTAANQLYQRLGYIEVEPYNENPNATDWYVKRLS